MRMSKRTGSRLMGKKLSIYSFGLVSNNSITARALIHDTMPQRLRGNKKTVIPWAGSRIQVKSV